MNMPIKFFLVFLLLSTISLQAAVEINWPRPVWLPADWFPSEQTEGASDKVLWDRAQEAEAEGKLRLALRCYRKLAKKYKYSDYAAPALYRTGILQAERKKFKKSFNAFTKLIDQYPQFRRFDEVLEQMFSTAVDMVNGSAREKWIGFIPTGASGTAILLLEAVIANAPYSDYSPLALLKIAEIHNNKKHYQEAIAAWTKFIDTYPQHPNLSEGYLGIAQAYANIVQGADYDQSATEESINYYRAFISLFPENEKIAEAEQGLSDVRNIQARNKLILGEYYYQHRNDKEAAATLLNDAITIAPESLSAQQARRWLEQISSSEPLLPSGDLLTK